MMHKIARFFVKYNIRYGFHVENFLDSLRDHPSPHLKYLLHANTKRPKAAKKEEADLETAH